MAASCLAGLLHRIEASVQLMERWGLWSWMTVVKRAWEIGRGRVVLSW